MHKSVEVGPKRTNSFADTQESLHTSVRDQESNHIQKKLDGKDSNSMW